MKNRIVAGFLSLFFGAFGVHHFYLGKHDKGILYLVFSWTLIPRIVSFFEAIRYFRMSDAEFNQKFNNIQPSYNTYNHLDKPFSTNKGSIGAADELLKLSQLLDKNLITFEEFERRKSQLLR